MLGAGLLALVDTAMPGLICALQDTNVLVEGELQEAVSLLLQVYLDLRVALVSMVTVVLMAFAA